MYIYYTRHFYGERRVYIKPHHSRSTNHSRKEFGVFFVFVFFVGAKLKMQLIIYLEPYSLAVKVSPPDRLYIPRPSKFGCLDYRNGCEWNPCSCSCASFAELLPRPLSARRRSLMLPIFPVVSHCDCYNLWPSLRTPSSPPQMFDFNLVVGRNLRELPQSWDFKV